MCSSSDNGNEDKLNISSTHVLRDPVYCDEDVEVRIVDADGALEKTDDTAVDADDIVEALEFVLESEEVSESLRSRPLDFCRVNNHFREGGPL